MDIHVRRVYVRRCRSESDCKSEIFHLRSNFRRGLGHECPGYMNRSRSDNNFQNDPERHKSCRKHEYQLPRNLRRSSLSERITFDEIVFISSSFSLGRSHTADDFGSAGG